eukprot:scaffold4856_cov29-Tisochrysis_lutea.AAC.3
MTGYGRRKIGAVKAARQRNRGAGMSVKVARRRNASTCGGVESERRHVCKTEPCELCFRVGCKVRESQSRRAALVEHTINPLALGRACPPTHHECISGMFVNEALARCNARDRPRHRSNRTCVCALALGAHPSAPRGRTLPSASF